ncbi:hypothetical protein [Oceanobacillus sp. 1P07AA]|uniref:hypothetical protein n=1 Tax=Oceanobacillus sp. 1P07AA TaxID=3132293 RepID=UPI0039A5E487
MKTCAFCATEIHKNYCAFCEMDLKDRYILNNGERIKNTIDYIPDQSEMFKNTKELKEKETIELLFLLRFARQYRSDIYNLRINVHKAEGQGADMQEYDLTSSDYEEATRKVWVIENIIKMRVGYFPQKIMDDFLDKYVERIEKSEKKVMKMRKKVN